MYLLQKALIVPYWRLFIGLGKAGSPLSFFFFFLFSCPSDCDGVQDCVFALGWRVNVDTVALNESFSSLLREQRTFGR